MGRNDGGMNNGGMNNGGNNPRGAVSAIGGGCELAVFGSEHFTAPAVRRRDSMGIEEVHEGAPYDETEPSAQVEAN